MVSDVESSDCFICDLRAMTKRDIGYGFYVNCPNCGKYSTTRDVLEWDGDGLKPEQKVLVSHALAKMKPKDKSIHLTGEMLRNILENSELPGPIRQMDNLIIEIGKRTNEGFGEPVEISKADIGIVGAWKWQNVQHLLSALKDRNLIGGAFRSHPSKVELTLDGWAEYERLLHEVVQSKKAFMAMPFGDSKYNLDELFEKCYIPAVRKTGFELERIDSNPPAGSIDNRLRVEIRRCRFLLAELTNENRGVYWEAGFAEGLGRPVIFTCNKEYFDIEGVHFDTRQHHTVLWDSREPEKVMEELKSTIRATLPGEAIFEDQD